MKTMKATTTTTTTTKFFSGVKTVALCVMMSLSASCARGNVMWDSAAAPMPAPMPAPAPAPGTDAGMMTRTVVDVAIEDPRFATLVTAVVAVPDVLEMVEEPGPWTVFAPTNDAFVTFLNENGLTVEQVLASPALPDILKKHVVPGTLLSSDAVAAVSQGPITLTTLGGVEIDARIVDGALYVGGAQVIQTDIMADNGVIHVIDRVVA
jgi:uncharacterized surface protein with fasciclin (FAS1) repeats